MSRKRVEEVVHIQHRSKPRLVAEKVKEEIAKNLINDTLPGYRVLMKRYSVSQITAKESILILEQEGVVGKGIRGVGRKILIEASEKSERTLLVLRSKEHLSMADRNNTFDIFDKIWKSYEGEVFHSFVNLEQRYPARQLRALRKKYKPDALVSFLLPEHWNSKIYESGIPFFLVGGGFLSDEFEFAGAAYSEWHSTTLILQKFKEKGHRRVLYPVTPAQKSVIAAIRHAYREVFPDITAEELTTYLPEMNENHPDVWQAFLTTQCLGVNPTGIIIQSLHHLISLFSFCTKNGVVIPKNLSVVSTKDSKDLEWFSPEISRVKYPFELQNKRFRKWVKSGCTDLEHGWLAMQWLEGGSIADLA